MLEGSIVLEGAPGEVDAGAITAAYFGAEATSVISNDDLCFARSTSPTASSPAPCSAATTR